VLPSADLWCCQSRPTKGSWCPREAGELMHREYGITCLVRHLCHFVGIQQGPREHSPGSGRDAGDDDMYRLRKFFNVQTIRLVSPQHDRCLTAQEETDEVTHLSSWRNEAEISPSSNTKSVISEALVRMRNGPPRRRHSVFLASSSSWLKGVM
jgi:hypothetical protein